MIFVVIYIDSMSLNSPLGAPMTGSELDRLGALGLPNATQVCIVLLIFDQF